MTESNHLLRKIDIDCRPNRPTDYGILSKELDLHYIITNCPNITEIDLQPQPNFSDLQIKTLSKTCQRLEKLNLYGSFHLSDISIKNLSEMMFLTHINISMCNQITIDSLNIIANFKSPLKSIVINHTFDHEILRIGIKKFLINLHTLLTSKPELNTFTFSIPKSSFGIKKNMLNKPSIQRNMNRRNGIANTLNGIVIDFWSERELVYVSPSSCHINQI